MLACPRDELCPDTHGHEEPHNATCLLTGPEGSWSVLSYTQDGSGSSFTYGSSSLYLHHENFTDIFSWLLVRKNGFYRDMSFDFLVHPTCGCNFADHYEFSMQVGAQIPNNNYGIADEGGWEDSTAAPPLDKGSKAYLASLTSLGTEDCDMATSTFNLHVLYDPSSEDAVDAKDCVLAALDAADLGTSLVDDDATAWLSPGNPFFVAEAQVMVPASGLASVLLLALQQRQTFSSSSWEPLDFVLAPVTGCPIFDYGTWSMYGGRFWKPNLAALIDASTASAPVSFPAAAPMHFARLVPGSSETSETSLETGGKQAEARCADLRSRVEEERRSSDDDDDDVCEASSPEAFVLYVESASNNQYSLAAKESFLANFSSAFDLSRESCTSDYPIVEPAYTELCMMQEVAAPYKSFSEPLTTNYGAIFVPAADLPTTLTWAMTHRAAPMSDYALDLLLVPLTGCPASDYQDWAMRAGVPWRINTDAF